MAWQENQNYQTFERMARQHHNSARPQWIEPDQADGELGADGSQSRPATKKVRFTDPVVTLDVGRSDDDDGVTKKGKKTPPVILSEYQGSHLKDAVTNALMFSCGSSPVVLSAQPIVLHCRAFEWQDDYRVLYWPRDRKGGEMMVRRLTEQLPLEAHVRLVNDLIQLAKTGVVGDEFEKNIREYFGADEKRLAADQWGHFKLLAGDEHRDYEKLREVHGKDRIVYDDMLAPHLYVARCLQCYSSWLV